MKRLEISYNAKLTKTEHRALDVLIEKVLIGRNVVIGNKMPNNSALDEGVSFLDPETFKEAQKICCNNKSRVVPHYSKAIEPCIHTAFPTLKEKGLMVNYAVAPNATVVDVARIADNEVVASGVHVNGATAASLAIVNAILEDDADKFFNECLTELRK